ncbi:hypothetical protein [Pseudosulfitobacter koreensis]|uniref:Uncharacterized protein n=1 Tax=Pseudosulfitobacter koreensis TaxID=2968472 RepID=A0ABT1YWV3_9RHOB|nr:hypothetical protein [Pseudosulfitobacter koreense]MCR8825347.1 hypothetical protein [Pseudosulfitobacter koreense]
MIEMFAQLRRQDYSFDDEGRSVGNVETYLANPIPFRLGDPAMISEFLVSYGHIMEAEELNIQGIHRCAIMVATRALAGFIPA